MKIGFQFLKQCHQFCILSFLLLPALVQAATVVSVDHRVKVSYSGLQFDSAQGSYSTQVKIKNHSGAPLLAPLRLSVGSIEGRTVHALNAGGTGADGLPYIEFPLPQGELGSGETTDAVTLTFTYQTEPGKNKRNDEGKRVSAAVTQSPLQPRAVPYALQAGSGPVEVRFSVRLADKDGAAGSVYLRNRESGQVYAMNDLKSSHGKGLHDVRITIDTATVPDDTCLSFEAYINTGDAEIVSPPYHLFVSSFPVQLAESDKGSPAVFSDGSKAVADEILLTVTPETSAAAIRELASSIHAKTTGSDLLLNLYQLKLASPGNADQLLEIARQLGERTGVVSASINAIGGYASTPSDPEFSSQHGLQRIRAQEVWDINATGSGETVIVLDSGIDRTHPDFGIVGDCQLAENDCGSASTEGIGHGTQVAGVVAAKTNNSQGVAGVAYGSKIHSIQVSSLSTVTATQIITGFNSARDYIVLHPEVSVINASFFVAGASATAAEWTAVCGAMDQAVLDGVTPRAVVVNAAGNNNLNGVLYPARCNDLNAALTNKALLITVANSTSMVTPDCGSVAVDQRCSTSNYGAWVDIAAPGSAIRTTAVGGTYTSVSGTSFSSPMVSGAVAILSACGVPLNEIESTLKTSANVFVPYPASGTNPAGTTPRLDIYRALQQRNRAPTAVSLSNSSLVDNTNTSAGVEVGTLTAADLDTCDKFTYSIVGGADAASFSITGSNADRLRITAGILNFATKPSYAVTVRVTDFANKSLDSNLTIVVLDTTAPVLTASVAGGTYTTVQSVTLSANKPATIYYTLDGTTPTTASTVYSAAITVSSSLTLKYYAVDTAGNASTVQTQIYVIDTVAPIVTASVAGGTYPAAQSVTLSANEPATIYYTLDGTTPTTASTVYSTAIPINSSATLKYYAVDTAGNASTVQTQTYVINLPDTVAPAGSVVINGGAPMTLSAAVSLTLAATDDSGTVAQMRFSNDGSTWSVWEAYATSKAWTLAAGDGTKTVYARYTDAAGNVSASVSDTIILDTTAPVVSAVSDSPDPFRPGKGQSATIRFTLADNLSGTCTVNVYILNSSGVLVNTLTSSASCPATGATGSMVWNGRNSAGVVVPRGNYFYRVQGGDTAANSSAVVSGTTGVR